MWLLFNSDALLLLLDRRSQSNAEVQCIVKCTDNDRPAEYQPVLHHGHGPPGKWDCLDKVQEMLWAMAFIIKRGILT